jgi:hypothetical protein
VGDKRWFPGIGESLIENMPEKLLRPGTLVNDVATVVYCLVRRVCALLVLEHLVHQVAQIVRGQLYQVNTKESLLYYFYV